MKAFALTAGMIGYFGLGYVQWLAQIDGLKAVLHWPTFLCGCISMFTSWVPLLGTAAGVWGAHAGWGWSWLHSFELFLGVPLLFLLVIGVLTMIAALQTAWQQHRRIGV